MLSSTQIKAIVAEARPIIERMLDDAELIAGFRTLVAEQGGDWSALKALLKAQIQDERDESGGGKRVQKIIEKAEFASAYADILGLGNMNEQKYIAPSIASFTINGDEYRRDPETGEIAFLGPHSQEVDDGRPHPSSNASGAKRDGAQTIVGRADDRSGLSITQLEQQDASASQDRNEPISDREATVSHSNTRDPHLLEADDGQPRTQSPDACGVKCDGLQPIVGHGGEKPKHASAQSEQSVTHSNTTLAASPEASRKAGEGVLLPLSPAANPDDDVPDFLKRGAA